MFVTPRRLLLPPLRTEQTRLGLWRRLTEQKCKLRSTHKSTLLLTLDTLIPPSKHILKDTKDPSILRYDPRPSNTILSHHKSHRNPLVISQTSVSAFNIDPKSKPQLISSHPTRSHFAQYGFLHKNHQLHAFSLIHTFNLALGPKHFHAFTPWSNSNSHRSNLRHWLRNTSTTYPLFCARILVWSIIIPSRVYTGHYPFRMHRRPFFRLSTFRSKI